MTNTVKNLRLSCSEECRLNSLPDPIRNHIVSFLPLEDAAKSSVLSRQWRHICSSLSNLNFDQSKYQNEGGETGFRNIVNWLLLKHDISSIISFNLSASVDNTHITDLHINAWVSFALSHNVQNLFVKVLSALQKQPLYCIFTCISLQVLSLDNMELALPRAISLPNLKTLKFFNVGFSSTKFTRKLLPNCPILDELVLQHCRVHPQAMTISVPTLKRLTLCCVFEVINIYAPKLQLIKCDSSLSKISSETLSSLMYAEIDTFLQLQDSWVTNILMGLTNVKSVCFLSLSVKCLYENLDALACYPTLSCSLRHLHLEMCPEEGQVQVLIVLLRGFTNLQSLNISFLPSAKFYRIDKYQQSKELSTELSTGYLLKNLKTVEIENFALEFESELDIVRYLVENAKVLEKINIKYLYNIKSKLEVQMKICETILTFTKISPFAKVVFL